MCAAGPRPFYVAALPLPPAAGQQAQAGGGASTAPLAARRALGGGAIAGIVVACVTAAAAAAAYAYWRLRAPGGAPSLPRPDLAQLAAAWARARALAGALPAHSYALAARLGLPAAAGAVRAALTAMLSRPAPP